MTEEEGTRGTRWFQSDLDRCEHGRHSIDSCFDCPGGKSLGNQAIFKPEVRMIDEELQVRIGTTYDGRPVWVTTHRRTPR